MLKFYLLIYYLLASKFPNYSVPFGNTFNALRIKLMRMILPIGSNCRIMRNIYIGSGKNIRIGHFCRINEGVRLANVAIGDHVMIARETIVLGRTHRHNDLRLPMERQGNMDTPQSQIKNNVWIGARVIILPGLSIEEGCIIGAGAVVTKSTVANGIYGGVPARLIKFRT
jgi:maltose O-acetyltransferase